MASEKQIAANRRNAGKSTGPRTTEGKAASSRNALKHGLLSKQAVSDLEDTSAFNALLAQLVDELEPVSVIECALVERIAILLWRERRLAQAETVQIDEAIAIMSAFGKNPPPVPALGSQVLVGRYQTMLSRQLRDALADLRREQDRRLSQINVLNSSAD